MVKRDEIVSFLNEYLRIGAVGDSSRNGIQVEGSPDIRKIVLGVSASLELFKKAVKSGAEMVIVHHGIVWDKPHVYTGALKEKLHLLFSNNVNLLAYHLPLDMHEKTGNNIQIMKYLGAVNIKPFGKYREQHIGFRGLLRRPASPDKIAAILSKKLDSSPLCFSFGPGRVRTLGVVSGGGQGMLSEAIEEKLDLYVTGEVSEFVQEMCREGKINFISAGHYNSEKAGILALAELLSGKFRVTTEFIDIPNPV